MFTENKKFEVHLQKSVNILGEYNYQIKNANINLYRDNEFLDKLTFNGKNYISNYSPKANELYRVEVSINEESTVSAVNYLPQPPTTSNLLVKDNIYADEEGVKMSQLEFNLKDNKSQKNYYEILILYDRKDLPYKDLYFDKTYNDPVLLNEQILDYYPDYLVFSDDLFDGKTYTMKINYETPFVDNNNARNKITFIIRAITEEYYRYKKRLIIHTYNQDSDLWNGGEPISMYTNVKNGFGIFAGYSEFRTEL